MISVTPELRVMHEVNVTSHDVVEAHATALNWKGTLLSNHVAKGDELLWDISTLRVFVNHKDPWGRNFSCNQPPSLLCACSTTSRFSHQLCTRGAWITQVDRCSTLYSCVRMYCCLNSINPPSLLQQQRRLDMITITSPSTYMHSYVQTYLRK